MIIYDLKLIIDYTITIQTTKIFAFSDTLPDETKQSLVVSFTHK